MLSEPHWLILIFPLLFLVFYFKSDSKILLSIRIFLILVLCLALSAPVIKLKGQEGVIVIVADRSASMPSDADQRIDETSNILLDEMPINSRLGLVSFNDKARIEFSPTKNETSALSKVQNPDASNLSEGIELGLSLIPDGVAGRLLIISDGLWNGTNPQNAVANAINRKIPIDYKYLGRGMINDLAISYLTVPKLLEPREPFILRAGIDAPFEQDVDLELFNGDNNIFKTKYHLKAGLNEISFNLFAPPSSVAKYRLKVSGSGEDLQLKNNIAQAVALVKGKKPVLIVSDSNKKSSLKSFFEQNNISSKQKKPNEVSWRLEDLNSFSAIVLDNIMGDAIGFNGMHSLNAWVKHMGGGLLMTGGKNSYGDGGYYQSPLDEALPISLEMRSESRKMSIAIAVVLDRSGSMAMQVSGRTKMELANLAAASSLDLLMPDDEFAAFAVDTAPHLVMPLQKVSKKEEWRDKLLSVRSEGGGIYVYEGIKAAIEELENAESKTRHIILFSDACDSEKPGEYWVLLNEAKRKGMTLSVIGLGKETDPDGNLLKKIAVEGEGRCFFTNEPEDLPRLFSQDTFLAVKSTFVDKRTDIYSSIDLSSFVGEDLNFNSSINAYNIGYLRPNASQIITADVDEKSPILSVWQYGLGRVACYTGVLGEKEGGDFLKTEFASKIFGGICDWIAYDDRNALGEISVSQKIENSVWKAYLNLDPDRVRDPFTQTPIIETFVEKSDGKLNHFSLKANWENADQLFVSCGIHGSEVVNSILILNDKLKLRLAPACQIYSPEFSPEPYRNGAKELKQLSKATGGNELIDLNSVWASMPMVYQDKNVSNYLFSFALILFLLEIAERRLALLSIIIALFRRLKSKRGVSTPKIVINEVKEPVYEGKTITNSVEMKIPEMNEKEEKKPENNKSTSFVSALKKAKQQADKRL